MRDRKKSQVGATSAASGTGGPGERPTVSALPPQGQASPAIQASAKMGKAQLLEPDLRKSTKAPPFRMEVLLWRRRTVLESTIREKTLFFLWEANPKWWFLHQKAFPSPSQEPRIVKALHFRRTGTAWRPTTASTT